MRKNSDIELFVWCNLLNLPIRFGFMNYNQDTRMFVYNFEYGYCRDSLLQGLSG